MDIIDSRCHELLFAPSQVATSPPERVVKDVKDIIEAQAYKRPLNEKEKADIYLGMFVRGIVNS